MFETIKFDSWQHHFNKVSWFQLSQDFFYLIQQSDYCCSVVHDAHDAGVPCVCEVISGQTGK